MHSLASLFLYCATIFSSSTKIGAHHSGDHDAITSKIASSVAMNGSFSHAWAGSLRVQIYKLCISDLNFSTLYKLLYTVGDKCGLRLIHVQKLASTNAQNTISRMLIPSFVAQSEVYLMASGRFLSMVGNWLSTGSSPETNKMDKRNHV